MSLHSWYSERIFRWIVERVGGPQSHALRARCVAGALGDVLENGLGAGRV